MTSAGRKWIVFASGTFLFLLVALVLFRIYGSVRLQRTADKFVKGAGPIEAGSYAPPGVKEMENGARRLEGGADSVVMTAEERGLLRKMTQTPFEKWDATSIESARAVIERNEPSYQVLAQAIPLEKSSFNLHYTMGGDMPIPNYLRIVQTEFMVGAKARLYFLEGNISKALEAMAIQERMAAALVHEPVVISRMIGEVAEKDFDALVQAMLLHADVSQLEALNKQLLHLQAATAASPRVFAADCASIYTTLREGYPQYTKWQSNMTDTRSLRWFYAVNKPLFLSLFLDENLKMIRRASSPLASQKVVPVAGWVINLLNELGNGESLIARMQATQAESNLARLSVKLCMHAKQNGAYPADLSAFQAEPSPFTGVQMHYEVLKDGSAILTYPDDGKFWDKQMDQTPRKPLFEWKLPVQK